MVTAYTLFKQQQIGWRKTFALHQNNLVLLEQLENEHHQQSEAKWEQVKNNGISLAENSMHTMDREKKFTITNKRFAQMESYL